MKREVIILKAVNSPFSTYRSFFSTHSFYEGVRITIGIMVPVLVAARFDEIGWGLAMALGSLCVSLTDNAGPIHHRVNGMLAAIGFILITSLLIGFSMSFPWLVFFLLGVFAFFFSLIGVFGTRAASIGTSVLVAITLQLTESPLGVWGNALLTTAGGVWYFLLSMSLYRIRPYKLAQQVLADCIAETGNYLQLKSRFYEKNADLESLYNDLLTQQVNVHNKQQVVREILFKTRSIIKESTHTGRVLVLAFLETVDLFETIMTSEQDYRKMQTALGHLDILPRFAGVLHQISERIIEIGRALQEGNNAPQNNQYKDELIALEAAYENSRHRDMVASNADAFNSLRNILEAIRSLNEKVENLSLYTTYDKSLRITRKVAYDRFVVPSYINIRMLLENLHWQSNIFRYSVRMMAAIVAGYGLSQLLPIGHSYWILLTIVVILKPAYALTRQRNIERLLGTVAGGIAGVLVLMSLKDKGWLLVIMICCMTGAFSIMRTRYWLSVSLLTLYVLIAIYLLQPGDYTPVFKDRLLDTFIGSLVSFSFTWLIPPIWERDQLRELLVDTLRSNRDYFTYIASAFTGNIIDNSQYKWYRKETYVALANLSDAFQRMLNEPKSRQQPGEHLHPMVVTCHVLASRIATLSGYSRQFARNILHADFEIFIQKGSTLLNQAIEILEHKREKDDPIRTENITTLIRQFEEERKHEWQASLTQAEFEKKKMQLTKSLLQIEAILNLAAEIRNLSRKLRNEDFGIN